VNNQQSLDTLRKREFLRTVAKLKRKQKERQRKEPNEGESNALKNGRN
jgi:hypothetical protein